MRNWPVPASQSLSVLSALPASASLPSEDSATESTSSECPSKLLRIWPVAASQSLTVLSLLPESACWPSATNAADVTSPACPSIATPCPVATSQIRKRASLPPARMRRPSGENATELVPPVCVSKVRSRSPVEMSQSLKRLSWLAETACRPSGESATAFTALEKPKMNSAIGLPCARGSESAKPDTSNISAPSRRGVWRQRSIPVCPKNRRGNRFPPTARMRTAWGKRRAPGRKVSGGAAVQPAPRVGHNARHANNSLQMLKTFLIAFAAIFHPRPHFH